MRCTGSRPARSFLYKLCLYCQSNPINTGFVKPRSCGSKHNTASPALEHAQHFEKRFGRPRSAIGEPVVGASNIGPHLLSTARLYTGVITISCFGMPSNIVIPTPKC